MIFAQLPAGSVEGAGVVAGAEDVAIGHEEDLKRLLDRALNTNGDFTKDDRRMITESVNRLQQIDKTVNAKDPNGTPLVYVPRRMIEVLEEIRDEMRQFNRGK